MRISFNGLIVVVILATGLLGCKARGQRGGVVGYLPGKARVARSAPVRDSVDRSVVSRRGTVACDCYACRSKRDVNVNPNTCLIQDPGASFGSSTSDPATTAALDKTNITDQPFCAAGPTVDARAIESSPVIQDQMVQQPAMVPLATMDPADQVPVVESDSIMAPTTIATQPSSQTIEGQIIEQQVETNTASDPLPATDQEASSESSTIGSTDDSAVETVPLEETDLDSPNEPGGIPADDAEMQFDLPQADDASDATATAPATVSVTEASTRRESKVSGELLIFGRKQVPPMTTPTALAAAIGSEEIKQAVEDDAIVLHARPVEHHRVYNSHANQAPIRQAQLLGAPVYGTGAPETQGRFAPPRAYFQKLPPMEERIPEPAPSTSIELTPVPIPPVSIPVPGKHDASRDSILLKGSSAASDRASSARVVQPADAPLLLKAVANHGERPSHPVVSITTKTSLFNQVDNQTTRTLQADNSHENQQHATALKMLPLFKVDSINRQAIERSSSNTIDR